jgi:outer membrane lipoprotein-sorting protein
VKVDARRKLSATFEKLFKNIFMKKVSLLVLLVSFVAASYAQTADDVINRFIKASGGKEKLNSIKTLQYKQVIRLAMPMEMEIPMRFYKDKNKLFRMETSMQLGPQSMDFFTVVSDTAAYVMMPANPLMGSEGGLQKLEEKERSSQVFQMDPAGYFGTLVDYASKGHKVELQKEEKVNDEACYKVKHTLRSGQEFTYLFSKATNLIVRMDLKGEMAASLTGMGAMAGGAQMDKLEVSSIFSTYKDFDGIMFPTKLAIKGPLGNVESEISEIILNKAIDAKLYKAVDPKLYKEQ